jgi:hypothetical protein
MWVPFWVVVVLVLLALVPFMPRIEGLWWRLWISVSKRWGISREEMLEDLTDEELREMRLPRR